MPGRGGILTGPHLPISGRRQARATIEPMPYGFKYLLVTPDGEPHNPAAFVTAVPNWEVGEVLTLGDGQRLRIVHINLELDEDALEELYEQGINGMWIVEPL